MSSKSIKLLRRPLMKILELKNICSIHIILDFFVPLNEAQFYIND